MSGSAERPRHVRDADRLFTGDLSGTWLPSLLEALPIAVSVRRTDYTLAWANSTYANLIGRPLGELLDRDLEGIIAHEEFGLEDLGAVPGSLSYRELLYTRADGTQFHADLTVVPLHGAEGRTEFLVGILNDVSDRVRLAANERELSHSQERFQALVENSPAITMLTDERLLLTYVSPSVEVTGWSRERLEGRSVYDLPATVVGGMAAELEQAISSSTARDFVWSVQTPDGPRWLDVSVVPELDDDPASRGLILVAVDHSERHEERELLTYRATHDSLTGLLNRSGLLAELERIVAASDEVSVFFVDLNGFKEINDTRGHADGDSVLRTIGDRLAAAVRDGDLIGRLGGDEFVVATGSGPASHPAMIARLRAALEPQIHLPDGTVSVSASIGIATGDSSCRPEDLLASADEAMYDEKRRLRAARAADPDHS